MKIKKSMYIKTWFAAFLFFLLSTSASIASDSAAGKTLILYYSKTGNTRAVCEALQKALDADLTEIKDLNNRQTRWGGISGMLITLLGWHTDIDPEQVDMTKYSLVILASPIWASKVAPALRTFIETNRFDGKKVVIFTTSGSFLEEKYQQKNSILVTKAGGDVAGYFQVQAMEEKNGQEIERTKDQMVSDTLTLVPEINKSCSLTRILQ